MSVKKISKEQPENFEFNSENINLANKLLSRSWLVEGYVTKGKKLGRKLGYRTCNIRVKNYVLPKSGVYASKVIIGRQKKLYSAAAYLGSRPTFKGKEVLLEIYIFLVKTCQRKTHVKTTATCCNAIALKQYQNLTNVDCH